jgi:hypothetical protein
VRDDDGKKEGEEEEGGESAIDIYRLRRAASSCIFIPNKNSVYFATVMN